ncbi:MAG TPA: hypothetical protein VHB21_27540, partial [Minicystis sp.]|nr:hypothetical protein [Minicystis sp.]
MAARKRPSKKTAFVPRVVFTVAVAAVVPALTPTSCGGDTQLGVAAGGFSGVFAVAMGGFSGVAAVAMSGFGGSTSGTTNSGGSTGTSGTSGTGGGSGGSATTPTLPPGVAAVAMGGFAVPPADLEGLLSAPAAD